LRSCAGPFGRLSIEAGPRSGRKQEMSLALAQSYGWNLAHTMMASIIIFRIIETLFGVADV
jgi:hypothetical protein